MNVPVPRRKVLLVWVALAAVFGAAAGSAIAILGSSASIRGSSYSDTSTDPAQRIDGKAAGLGITLSDDNVVAGMRGESTLSITSNAQVAEVEHALTQRTPNGLWRLNIAGRRRAFANDPAIGVQETRKLLADVRSVADQIFLTGEVPTQLPQGVDVRFAPAEAAPEVVNTLRVLAERQLILGLASLATGLQHAVDGSPESSLAFGPSFLDGLRVTVEEARR